MTHSEQMHKAIDRLAPLEDRATRSCREGRPCLCTSRRTRAGAATSPQTASSTPPIRAAMSKRASSREGLMPDRVDVLYAALGRAARELRLHDACPLVSRRPTPSAP